MKSRSWTARLKRYSILPGFGLTLGFSMLYLSLIVLIPLSTLLLKTCGLDWGWVVSLMTAPRMRAAFALSFGAAAAAALINLVFGSLVAWILVRYDFPGRRVLDALVDLPFALPTAVSGITLTALYAPSGWIGGHLARAGIPAAFSPLGVVIALTFIGLPFVVRTLQPALEDLDPELEDAAASLGAGRWQTFIRVIVPSVFPALLTGATLAFARALGEYGSVIFISGNLPLKTEIVPLLIVMKLEQFDVAGATAIAFVLLVASLLLLLLINLLPRLARHENA